MLGLLQVVLSRDSDDAPIHLNSLASAGVLKAFDNTLLTVDRSAVSIGEIRIELSAQRSRGTLSASVLSWHDISLALGLARSTLVSLNVLDDASANLASIRSKPEGSFRTLTTLLTACSTAAVIVASMNVLSGVPC